MLKIKAFHVKNNLTLKNQKIGLKKVRGKNI